MCYLPCKLLLCRKEGTGYNRSGVDPNDFPFATLEARDKAQEAAEDLQMN